MKNRGQVALKGTREGFLILLEEQGDFAEVLNQLREKLSSVGDFFRGGGAVVDVGRRELSPEEYAQLVRIMQDEHGLALNRVAANLPERNRPDGRKGVVVLRQISPNDICSVEEEKETAPRTSLRRTVMRLQQVEDNALFVYRTLRSGQRINYDGSVVVMGDVNPGAEVVARGDILVMGALRGLAHAGARGSGQAIVAAFCLAPTQLRLASLIARAPDEEGAVRPYPEVARIRDGTLVIERYLD